MASRPRANSAQRTDLLCAGRRAHETATTCPSCVRRRDGRTRRPMGQGQAFQQPRAIFQGLGPPRTSRTCSCRDHTHLSHPQHHRNRD